MTVILDVRNVVLKFWVPVGDNCGTSCFGFYGRKITTEQRGEWSKSDPSDILKAART